MFKTRTFISYNCINNIKKFKSSQYSRSFDKIKNDFETRDIFLPEAYSIISIDGVNFKKFTNSFHKPIDQRNVNLMNECALDLFKFFKNDIACAYGFSDEFNFIINNTSQLFKRNST